MERGSRIEPRLRLRTDQPVPLQLRFRARGVEWLGAGVVGRCRVARIEKQGIRFRVETGRGTVLARDVVVATNGYTKGLTPWLQRRVTPIGSYMIATEPIPRALMDRLIPKNRIVSDTRKVVSSAVVHS